MSTGNCQLMHCDTPSSTESDTWSSLFVSRVSTEQKSLLFVKRLVAVVVSSVTYLRGLFPETAYEDKVLDGLTLKILSADPKFYAAKVLYRCLMGAFEAIEKRYVDELRLVIYDDMSNPECLRETYTMKFAYAEVEGVCGVTYLATSTPQRTLVDLKGSTGKLLRTLLVLTQSLEELPDRVYAALHLTYREETPLDYEPPLFWALPEEPIFPQDAVRVKVGAVKTLHHKISVRIKTSDHILTVPHPQAEVSSSAFVGSQPLVLCSEEPLSPAEPSLRRQTHKSREMAARSMKPKPFSGRNADQKLEHSSELRKNLGEDLDTRDLRGVRRHKGHCSICNSQHHAFCFTTAQSPGGYGECTGSHNGLLGCDRMELLASSQLTEIALKPSVKELLRTPINSPVMASRLGYVGASSSPSLRCAVDCAQRSQGISRHVCEGADVPLNGQNRDARTEGIVGRDSDPGCRPDGDTAPEKNYALQFGLDGNRGGELEGTGKAEEGRRGKWRPGLSCKRFKRQKAGRPRELMADEAKAQQGGRETEGHLGRPPRKTAMADPPETPA